MKYISKKMIEDGLMSKVIVPFLDDGVLKVQIGEHYFYFDGNEFEGKDPKDIPFEILAKEIKKVFDAFYECQEIYGDEYLYYYNYLCDKEM